MLQRIIYLNKDGYPYDRVWDIIGKRSKNIIVKDPMDGKISEIAREDIESISEPEIEKEKTK